MNPGELNKRITIQRKKTTLNSYGENIQDWENLITIWASINPIVGKEYFAAETINSEVTHKIKVRYLNIIKPNMRIEFNSRIFTIQSIINYKENNTELQIMCNEEVK
jgi:SPP1 family predicted phage head-tail adaptor